MRTAYMNIRSWIPAFAGMTAVALSGCISIATHEQQMKKCRDGCAQQEAALNAKNAELEKTLVQKEEEHEALQSEMSNVRNTYDELVQELKDSIAEGDVGVKETPDGLTITLGDKILFQSGKADLQPKGKKVLGQVAGIVKKTTGRLIQVQGHTDNVKIAGPLKSIYPSNWELSAARAASVVRFLQETGKIDPSILVLTAYGETRPVEDNSTPAGRKMNRRVEIKLIPQKAG